MHNVNNTQIAHQNDEINLAELIFSIWKKKWWVIGVTFIFAMGSIFYALNAKEQWTSKAEVLAPQKTELNNILKYYLNYTYITNTQTKDLDKELYNEFMYSLKSINVRNTFFKQSDIFKELSADLKTEKEKNALLYLLSTEQLSVTLPDGKKNKYPIISFYSENPLESQKTLSQFIDFVNNKAVDRVIAFLDVELDNKISELDFKIKQLNRQLLEQKQVKLNNLKIALETAKKAGIKEYSKEMNAGMLKASGFKIGTADITLADDQLSNNGFLFLLGENYLQAQINTLESSAIVYPPHYYDMKTQRLQLNELKTNHHDMNQAKAYFYQSKPSYPLKKDKPKRALIVLIGTFAGGVLGLLVALLMSSVEAYRKREME